MTIVQPDTELEYEIQELYILAKHRLQDISFAEDELHFFKNLLKKYQGGAAQTNLVAQWAQFSQKIDEQEQHIVQLKKAIPQFLEHLKPYVADLKKAMSLNLLEQYNGLDHEIKALFAAVKTTKKSLFACAETVINAGLKN
ncbi:hypothetical protein BDD43_3792 [Mucilaginibacter gracilis]|uniref:Uncharacterized protein n=1 Tax=Mucilaginibacter gracilis TaxID=423350 RepID=A0A495J4Q4_9SPHI|nr:hypothetical protein [Mucilaginibacter gracilis]RKR83582.1 hypothetical protein BDD43_3792 [Mucilaginibacter gracilis]